VYGISVAAELVGTGVQNLRAYEARGLLEPERTEGGTRRYSANDLERLRRIAHLHLDRLSRDRDLAIVFQVELRQTTKFMERFSNTLLRDYLGILRDVIAQGQAAGVVRPDINPTLAAKMLFGALDEMATNWMLSHRRSSLDGVADAVVDVFVHGIGAPATQGGPRP